MLQIERSHWIPTSPETIYTALTTPETLTAVVKRILDARVLHREGEAGEILLTLDLPARKTAEYHGKVEGVPGQNLRFSGDQPFKLAFVWMLEAQPRDSISGTAVTARMEIDMRELVAPFSHRLISGMLAAEIAADLERLENYLLGEMAR